MTVKLYDTLAHAVVPLDTREEGRVAMYCCGPTVYNYIHIGNARTFLWFDVIRRYLEYRGYDVTYVMNYTDVDDKIIERARFENLPPDGISLKYTSAFESDMAALGVAPADVICRATDHIDDMVKTIETLIERGIAYEVDGNVFFSIGKFPGYGRLSGRSADDMHGGERIEPHPGKRHPLDFALWKSAKEGEPWWSSPWGNGRPGWHIECSVMSAKYLGPGFDLHGGGSDLVFPHHENEIAQAESVEPAPFARHWYHAGMVQIESEKMSKSLGNFVLIHDILETFPGEVVRYWALQGSYRSQVVFSEAALQDCAKALERWKTFLSSARHTLGEEWPPPEPPQGGDRSGSPAAGFEDRFKGSMDEDFNTPEAFAVLHDLVGEGNRVLDRVLSGEDAARSELTLLARTFLSLTAVVGFVFDAPEGDRDLTGKLVEYLLELREEARTEKAFARADAIREKLTRLGVTVEDTPAGPRWR